MALKAATEAAGIWRRLVSDNEATGDTLRLAHFRAHLAECLISMSNGQLKVGSPGKARRSAEEALGIYRQLAETSPTAQSHAHDDLQSFEKELVFALSTFGGILQALHRPHEALATFQEGVDISRRLAEVNPLYFEPIFLDHLSNLAAVQATTGRPRGAVQTLEKALAAYKRLARENPALHKPDVARVLLNLAVSYSHAGDAQAARENAEQAVAHYRWLADASPGSYESELASAQRNLDEIMLSSGLPRETAESVGALVRVQPKIGEPKQPRADRSKSRPQRRPRKPERR